LKEKLNGFAELCGEWDFRNIDMTEAHLAGIDIVKNAIIPTCEIYSPDIDDYVSCGGNKIQSKRLVNTFKNLDLNNLYEVKDFIEDIESEIDWNKVEKEILRELEKQKKELEVDETEDNFEDRIVPAKTLGEGWNWHKYDDGSGHLESPDGNEYMIYDLCTNEYKETLDSSYDFFPLSYYYADGVDPSEFKPFDYMEHEMSKYLAKEKEISL